MDIKDRALLDKVAEFMIAEAQAEGSDRIFSATGFAREHISILHQQMRCTNLAWALGHTKRVKRGDVVAIVGGSFSGLMLACSIAIADDAIVYIFEKEKRLLHRFLDKSQRHLSHNLNSRYLGKGFSPKWSTPFFLSPIFQWERGVASGVASVWLHEFEDYRRKLPIFTFLGYEVSRRNIRRRGGGLTIDLRGRAAPHVQPIDVDLLIDATGFGEETNPHGLADYSYWEAGHRLIYDHLPKDCSVLVSGCGDSGLIEAMHYAIAGFRHEFVEDLWPLNSGLEADLDPGLEEAKLDDVLKSKEVARYNGRVLSELCWWLDTWFRLEHWKSHDWSLRRHGGHAPQIFRAIEAVLQPHLRTAFPGRNLKHIDWEEREDFVFRLPLRIQLEVRDAVKPIADDWISRSMAKLVGKVAVGKLLRVRKLHGMFRPGVTVTLNGTTPTPYTRQLSPYNVWLMRILTSFPNVRYRQGLITKVEDDGLGRFGVTYKDQSREVYDRVVTRYGPGQKTRRLSTPHSSDPYAGSWLLTPVNYSVPTEDPRIWQSVNPAVHRVARNLDEVAARRGSNSSKPLDKFLYTGRLLLGPMPPLEKDERYLDPQRWLSSKLRAGVRPSYVENTLLKRRRRQGEGR
jgi:hypothetical protein